MDFRETDLWKDSLAGTERDARGAERERLRSSYLSTRTAVLPVLGETGATTPDFTQHDGPHSDALWETALLVHGGRLTPPECWLLGLAFLFHDAAMGRVPPHENVAERMKRDQWRDLVATTFFEMRGVWPDDAEVDEPPLDVRNACETRAIRKTHASRGSDLVVKPWSLNGGDAYLIEDNELRDNYGTLIGDLAASHWWDVDTLHDRFGDEQGALPSMPEGWTVDPLKLACILRLADAAQIDSRRAPGFLFALKNPQGVSRQHWLFQKNMVRPKLQDDRLVYSSTRVFRSDDASAWWQAITYLQDVDRELKRVDHLLSDLRRPRMAARGVAGIGKPERFTKYFKVEGWQPIDATVDISDVRSLVSALGGEQLYGPNRSDVGLREAIQNAQDAILARRVMEPGFAGGEVVVRLVEEEPDWVLEVHDDGVGMDVDMIKDGLLDFGRSGWRTDAARKAFPGLMSGGFRPAGTFGVGFYSLLMLGNQVTVMTRRFDLGMADARQLSFDNGLHNRPMVCVPPERPLVAAGTVVRVVLGRAPREGGLLATTSSDRLVELVRRMVPSHSVPITVVEQGAGGERRDELAPIDLATASPEEVFDQLYPPREGYTDDEGHRLEARAEFCAQATEVVGDDGERLGLAVLGEHVSRGYHEALGVVVLHGFRADRRPDFTGYLDGRPRRASRDQVEPVATPEQLGSWVMSQVQRLRERGIFDTSAQLELAGLALRAGADLPDDWCVGLTADGPVTIGDIATWAAGRDEILLSYRGPCEWETRPPGLWHRPGGRRVTPPQGWLVVGPYLAFPTFDGVFPSRRDPAFASHRGDPGATWQKRWFRVSGELEGSVLRRIAAAWSCAPGDLLGPPAERDWQDRAAMLPDVTPSLVLQLERPRPSSAANTRRTLPSRIAK